MKGMLLQSNQASGTAGNILRLFERDASKLTSLGRSANSTIRVHQLMQSKPMTNIQAASTTLGISHPTVAKAIENLQSLGIVHEVTGRQRGRIFVYSEYLSLLSEGTEPLRR